MQKEEELFYVLKSKDGFYLGKDLLTNVSSLLEAAHLNKLELSYIDFDIYYYEPFILKITYDLSSISNTLEDESLWYGVNDHFE